MVSKRDRDDYEEGQRDRHAPFVEQTIRDIAGQHPGSDAYYKGRDGEQLDGDKKEK